VFFFTIAAFEFFWSTALDYRNSLTTNAGDAAYGLSDFQLWTLGYALFIWLVVNNLLSLINPDLCLATVVLLIAAIAMRMKFGLEKSTVLYGLFGAMLGLGYLVKAVMFPMGIVFLAVSFFVRKSRRHRIHIVLSLATFLLVSAPQILLLSISERHLTFSDTGKLAFLWYNYDLPLRNWQGEPPGSGIPLHPTRKLWSHPSVFEFNGPVRASYPPWYNPGYWNAGMAHPLQPGLVMRHTIPRIGRILSAFAEPKAWLVGVLLILLGANIGVTARTLLSYWHLIVPAIAIMAMYSLTWVDFRYLAVWEILLWCSLLLSVRKRSQLINARVIYNGLAISVALALLSAGAYGSYGQIIHGRRDDARPEYATTEGLLTSGLRSGDKVAALGFDNDAHWAHLGGFSVVAEINSDEACQFWSSPPSVQSEILQKLTSAGVKAVVANFGGGVMSTSPEKPDLRKCARPLSGWHSIPGSPNEVLMLR
jgi:hypothetical protein